MPILVGILNTTPDSFSDGGDFLQVDKAVAHALAMEKEGASIIDVGGESTRPGAQKVTAEEQISRVVPVIKAIRQHSDVTISIDTTQTRVALAAIDVGASIINDVSAGMEDSAMFPMVATTGAGIVLMHRRLPPELDTYSDQYEIDPVSKDIVEEVTSWLLERVSVAIGQGVPSQSIAIDPGLGFGKSVDQNILLMEQVDRIVASGYPVYVGASRKSFLGVSSTQDVPKSRDEASTSVAFAMAMKGVQIFRVHNVSLHTRVLQSPITDEHER